MPDAAEERGFLTKPVSAAGTEAFPPRAGEALRRFTDFTYPPKPDVGTRCLNVGRGITLSGEVTSCDKLFIEGSVDVKLTNCRIIEIAELAGSRVPPPSTRLRSEAVSRATSSSTTGC